jgi:DNA-binding NtrC family response regulator
MSGENILVADDSPEIRTMLVDYLTNLGYRVQAAPDGRKACTLIKTQSFELLITDLQMPFVDGLGVLETARQRDQDLPVIILTGHPTLESAIGSLHQGAYGYLLKPVENLDELGHIVANALAHRRLTLENRRLLEELRVVNASLAQRVEEQTQQLREAY